MLISRNWTDKYQSIATEMKSSRIFLQLGLFKNIEPAIWDPNRLSELEAKLNLQLKSKSLDHQI
jgi:hypothetical protein